MQNSLAQWPVIKQSYTPNHIINDTDVDIQQLNDLPKQFKFLFTMIQKICLAEAPLTILVHSPERKDRVTLQYKARDISVIIYNSSRQ